MQLALLYIANNVDVLKPGVSLIIAFHVFHSSLSSFIENDKTLKF